MHQAFASLPAIEAMGWGLAFFGSIYLLFGAGTWLLTREILPSLGVGQRLDPRPLAPGQLHREWRLSAQSIAIFGIGIGMIVPWGLLHSTYAFHPIEALTLGNVILLPMELHDFSVWSLLSVPLFSLLFNSMGQTAIEKRQPRRRPPSSFF